MQYKDKKKDVNGVLEKPHWNVARPNGSYENVIPGEVIEAMQKDPQTLICKGVTFYTFMDQQLFFTWINRTLCIDSFTAASDELYLHLVAEQLSDEDLQELIGIFYRYKIDMKQLSRFVTEQNKHWFSEDKKAFWHRRVFGE